MKGSLCKVVTDYKDDDKQYSSMYILSGTQSQLLFLLWWVINLWYFICTSEWLDSCGSFLLMVEHSMLRVLVATVQISTKSA